jgi:hypothetical protein
MTEQQFKELLGYKDARIEALERELENLNIEIINNQISNYAEATINK